MSVRALCSYRHFITPALRPVHLQRRYARVQDIRWVTTQGQSIADKYKDKLAEKARAEGHESIASLKEAYSDKIKEQKKKKKKSAVAPPQPQPSANTSGGLHEAPPPPPQAHSPAQTTKATSKSATPGIKPLSAYLDLDKVRSLPNTEIEYLWRLRHASNSKSLCAVVPLETYKRIYETATAHPRFILPLPRPEADDGSGEAKQSADGFEGGARTAADIHFLQWGIHPPAGGPAAPGSANTHTSTILFTHLAAFKLHGEFAQPHTTVTHHLDLADSHSIVLLNGMVMEGKGVSVEESKWLLMCMQKFYDYGGHGAGVGKEKRQGLLKKFSQGDASFNVNELMDEAERIS